MSDRGRPEPPSRRGSALWLAALVLAAAATAIMVLSEDARVLKLGLVAALWAALMGAFGIAKLRGKVAADAQRAAERQRIYELELEREIAARREYEAEAEAAARRKAAQDADGEIQALKAELRSLRENLEKVLGGDVLFERVALRAESTRVRSLAEHGGTGRQRVVQQTDGRGKPLPVGYRGHVEEPEASTQVINRVEPPRQPKQRTPRPPQDRPRQAGEARKPQNAPGGQGAWPAVGQPEQAARPQQVQHQPNTAGQPSPEPPRHPAPAVQQVPHSPATRQGPPAESTAAQEPVAAQEDSAEGPAPQVTHQVAAGAHTEGTSVTDLLAAYGGASTSGDAKRRRRRRE